MTDRKSPSGPVSSVKGTIAIASTAVATTAAATATGSFQAITGTPAPNITTALAGVVSLSPQANLTASIAVAWARVVATNIVAIGFTNTGASTAQAAVTFDADIQIE
jgi:hypothetical protein